MAVLSHAVLLLASLFASPVGGADGACQPTASETCVSSEAFPQQGGLVWSPSSHRRGVRVYDVLRVRGGAPLRVVGRFAFKTGPEEPAPEFIGWSSPQFDQSNRDHVVDARAEEKPAFPRAVAVGLLPTEVYDLRAPVTALERPPRV